MKRKQQQKQIWKVVSVTRAAYDIFVFLFLEKFSFFLPVDELTDKLTIFLLFSKSALGCSRD